MKNSIEDTLVPALSASIVLLALAVAPCLAENAPPDGVLALTPVFERSCVAVAIPIGQDQAVVGLRWYNNDVETVFPMVMAAAGYSGAAPNYEDAIVIVENVSGAEDAWSGLMFDTAVASPTGCMYVVFQLPAHEQTTERGVGPGIGYLTSVEESSVYLSADGLQWQRLVTDKSLLVEPIYVDTSEKGAGKVLLLPKPSREEMSDEKEDVAAAVIKPTALLPVFPNPFNPKATIAFELEEPGRVDVSIYDVRGRRVRQYTWGRQDAGHHEITWLGDDSSGRRVASGVYFVKMQAGDYRETRRAVMLK